MEESEYFFNRLALLELFDHQMRREITYPDMRKDILGWGIRFVRPAPGMSFISYYSLNEGSADAAIREQIDYFKAFGQPFSWTVYEHDPPGDMKERLLAHGFTADEPATLMVMDTHSAPTELVIPVQQDVRRIDRKDQLGDVIRVLEQVWGGNFDWVWERMGSHLEIPGYLSIYAAYFDGLPASVGWTYYYPNSSFAALFGGSTVTERRGHGLYKAILARRIQESINRGVRFLSVETTSMSKPIVARFNFQELSVATDFKLELDAK